MNDKSEIAKIVLLLAEYYNKILSPNQIKMYVEDLSDLSPDELLSAVHEYRNKPENEWFPFPAKLKALARPTITDEQNSIDAVSRIIQAIGKYGPYQNDKAKEFIGELGWFIVQRDGGWQNVCQNFTEENMGQFRAQWREMGKAFSARSMAGSLDTPPVLPGRAGSLGINLSKLLHKMPGMNLIDLPQSEL
jgi:hypothetical protein